MEAASHPSNGSPMRPRLVWSLPAAMSLLCSACAHYAPLPLPTHSPLRDLPAQRGGRGETTEPYTIGQVVSMALTENSDLKAARTQWAVAQGQVKQAGILPNPQISGAFLPLLSGSGTVPAWNLGLAQGLRALLTYKNTARAARDDAGQIAATIVWQEWQTAGKARQLATDLILTERSRPAYAQAYAMLNERNAVLDKALAAGHTTLTAIAPDRVALQGARAALDGMDQSILSLRHQLNALLGLGPDARLELTAEPQLPPFDLAAVRAGLPTLADRRPDLLALRLGYAASDERVRAAILAQFPDIVLGASVSSDNARVINGGPNVQLGLPIFDRNQGNVAIARATRAQLHAEYTARLAATTGEVGAMASEYEQLALQLARARQELPAAVDAARQAQIAFEQKNLDARGYVDLVTNRYAKEQEIMTLEQQLLDRQIAIQTLVGDGLPTASLPPAPTAGRVRMPGAGQ